MMAELYIPTVCWIVLGTCLTQAHGSGILLEDGRATKHFSVGRDEVCMNIIVQVVTILNFVKI